LVDEKERRENFTKPDGVALKEHLETRLAAQRDYFLARFEAVEKATDLMAEGLLERLAGIALDIADLKRSRDVAAGKASQSSVIISMLFGLAGVVLGIVGLLLR